MFVSHTLYASPEKIFLRYDPNTASWPLEISLIKMLYLASSVANNLNHL